MLADPRILILDEATANIDTRTEALIQKALATLLAGRTSIVIAHRLSTIRSAAQILVVDAGRVVERGTHDGLMAQDGLYADLYRRPVSRAGARQRQHEGRFSLSLTGPSRPPRGAPMSSIAIFPLALWRCP